MKTNSIISFACAITLMACSNGNKAVTTDGHNAENSLDYDGTYYGVLPAADCPGINVTLTLNKDKSYTIVNDYIERSSYTEKGTYEVNENTLTLVTEKNDSSFYKIGENTLQMLDREKKVIESPFSDMYFLRKPTTVKTLTSGKYSFDIQQAGDMLRIVPSGLEIDNTPMTQNIMGYTLTGMEIADLNSDTYPEVLLFLTSDGSGSYVNIIGYSVNNGKSISQIHVPELSEKASEGYMGHDSIAVENNVLYRIFPIYKEKDSNANPTGGTRKLSYKLTDGESCRILEIAEISNNK